MSHLRSCLGRFIPDDPMSESEKDQRARENFRAYSDMQALRLSRVRDEITLRVILNELESQHGARPKRRG